MRVHKSLAKTFLKRRQASTMCALPDGAPDPLVQYVVLRRDLWTDLGWPLGSVVAQACHASTAAIFSTYEDEYTQQYISTGNLDSMTKVVLEAKSLSQLENLSQRLSEAGIKHKLWVEQPENYPTCLATQPYPKSQVGPHLKKFNLCKTAVGSR